jgi:hypothetical protein
MWEKFVDDIHLALFHKRANDIHVPSNESSFTQSALAGRETCNFQAGNSYLCRVKGCMIDH